MGSVGGGYGVRFVGSWSSIVGGGVSGVGFWDREGGWRGLLRRGDGGRGEGREGGRWRGF